MSVQALAQLPTAQAPGKGLVRCSKFLGRLGARCAASSALT